MAKDPAFLFYSADFMMGTMLLTMEEKGQYITLLSVMHQQGRLSEEEVEVVIKGKPSVKLSSKFRVDETGLWYNERLEEETGKRKKFTESRRNSLNIDNDDLVNIYLMADPKSGYYKIGSSKYPMLRLTDMQKKNPDVIMVWKSETLIARSNEKLLHEEFKAKRVKNDWFALSEEDLASIAKRKIFRTNTNNESRTEARTVNENVNVNTNEIVFGIKKERSVAVKKVFLNDLVKRIYDLEKYFEYTNQLEELKTAGIDKFEQFMEANPANVFDDDKHLYNSFRRFCTTPQENKKKNGTKKLTLKDLSQ